MTELDPIRFVLSALFAIPFSRPGGRVRKG